MEGRLRAINSFAPIQRCQQSQVAVGDVLELRAFDLQRTLEMDDGFLDTDATHEHDASVTSLAIAQPGEVDGFLLDAWIRTLLREKGTDIFRTKGILAIAGSSRKCVYQGVHMIFTGEFVDDRWGDAPRINRLVFIGKHLDRAELTASFEACLVPPLATSRSVDWT